jgi:hypothetical protein
MRCLEIPDNDDPRHPDETNMQAGVKMSENSITEPSCASAVRTKRHHTLALSIHQGFCDGILPFKLVAKTAPIRIFSKTLRNAAHKIFVFFNHVRS